MSQLLTFGPGRPHAALMVEAMGDLWDRLADAGTPPEVVIVGAGFFQVYRDHIGADPRMGEVFFRGVKVLRDVDCPGVWMGKDPSANVIPIGPRGPTIEEATVQAFVDYEKALLHLQEELRKMAEGLEENRSTKWVARKLWSLAGPRK